MKKKIFILGIGGLTGSKLAKLARENFEIFGSYNLRTPSFDFIKGMKLDITDTKKLKDTLANVKPDLVINTCAISSVDYCENHKEGARKINVDVVKDMVEISHSIGSKFVHLSSDSVFDGTKKTPYTEDDLPKPINFYGYTKMESEKIVLEYKNNLVVRASVLYGWLERKLSSLPSSSMKPTNFAQWLINKLRSGEEVKIITDEYSSPIIADDFAKSILHLGDGNYNGIFHSAPPIMIDRYDFSVRLAKFLGYNWELIRPTTNKELGRAVTTGFNKCLDSRKISTMAKFQFISLEESFAVLRQQISLDENN
jgi:dTDP-4-dehydrorhamnose reductase